MLLFADQSVGQLQHFPVSFKALSVDNMVTLWSIGNIAVLFIYGTILLMLSVIPVVEDISEVPKVDRKDCLILPILKYPILVPIRFTPSPGTFKDTN